MKHLFKSIEEDVPVVRFATLLVDKDEAVTERMLVETFVQPWVQLACGLLGATNENQISVVQSEDGDEAYDAIDVIQAEFVEYLALPSERIGYHTVALGTWKDIPVVFFFDTGMWAFVALTEDLK